MKLKLDELKIQSFVTSLETSEKLTVQGGAVTHHLCAPGWPGGTQDNTQTGYPCPDTSCQYGGGDDDPPPSGNGCGAQSGIPAGCTDPGTGYTCYVQGC